MIHNVGWRPDWRWHDLLLGDALSRVTTYTTGGQTRTNAYNADGTRENPSLVDVTGFLGYTAAASLVSPLDAVIAPLAASIIAYNALGDAR